MRKIKYHYISVAQQLDIPNEMLGKLKLINKGRHYVVVPIDSLNGMVVKALRYARSLSSHVVAFHVETYFGEADKLRRKWAMLNTDIPLVVKESPYRNIVGTLLEYIDSEEHASKPGDMITLLLPQFFIYKWYLAVLHNNTSLFIANAMLNRYNIVVAVIPFHLEAYIARKKEMMEQDNEGKKSEISIITEAIRRRLNRPDNEQPED